MSGKIWAKNSTAISRTLTGCSCRIKVQWSGSVTRPESLPASVARWFKEERKKKRQAGGFNKSLQEAASSSLCLPSLLFLFIPLPSPLLCFLSLSLSLCHTWKCGKRLLAVICFSTRQLRNNAFFSPSRRKRHDDVLVGHINSKCGSTLGRER